LQKRYKQKVSQIHTLSGERIGKKIGRMPAEERNQTYCRRAE